MIDRTRRGPALRAAGFGAALALLLAACGEQAPPEGGTEQQGSINPPAQTSIAMSEQATGETSIQ
jgi:hypothetical protein